MQLHHEPVLHRHPGHFHHHVVLEDLEILVVRPTRQGGGEEGLHLGERGELRPWHPRLLKGRYCTERLELSPPHLQCPDKVGVRVDLDARALPEPDHIRLPLRVLEAEKLVRDEGGLDALRCSDIPVPYSAAGSTLRLRLTPGLVRPPRRLTRTVGVRGGLRAIRARRGVRGHQGHVPRCGRRSSQHPDPKVSRKSPRRILRGVQLEDHEVVHPLGVRAVQLVVHPEHAREGLLDPHAARCAQQKVKVLRQNLPVGPLLLLGEVRPVHVRRVQRPLRLQESHHEPVRGHEDPRRRPEGREPGGHLRTKEVCRARLGVRRQYGQRLHRLEQLVGRAPLVHIRIEEPVLLLQQGDEGGLDPVGQRHEALADVRVRRVHDAIQRKLGLSDAKGVLRRLGTRDVVSALVLL